MELDLSYLNDINTETVDNQGLKMALSYIKMKKQLPIELFEAFSAIADCDEYGRHDPNSDSIRIMCKITKNSFSKELMSGSDIHSLYWMILATTLIKQLREDRETLNSWLRNVVHSYNEIRIRSDDSDNAKITGVEVNDSYLKFFIEIKKVPRTFNIHGSKRLVRKSN